MFRPVIPRSWDPVKVHDYFNLVVIGLLNVLNLAYLATGEGFDSFWTASQIYFLIDTIFVGIYPQSVKSPVVILCHHICTSLYMLIPYYYPHYHWCMAACMLVEVNTWLLIARRTLGGKLTEIAFYATWVGLRNVYYPYLIWAFYKEWQHETAACGSPWNPILVTPVMQSFLTALNYRWTLELLVKLWRPTGGADGGSGGKGGRARGGKGAKGRARSSSGERARYDKHL